VVCSSNTTAVILLRAFLSRAGTFVAGHLGSSILASSYIEGRCQCRGPRRQPNSVSALGPRSRRCRGPPAALSGRNVTRPGPEVDIESLSTRAHWQPGPAPLRLCLSSSHRPRPEAPAAGRRGSSYPAWGKVQSLREKRSVSAGKKFQPCGKKDPSLREETCRRASFP